jgi:exonuclease SbcC
MLPIHLKINGIFSYQNLQEIDFTKLTSAGLFGIFGAVGSGKSAILDCICFALYGEIERLNNRDSKAYNMLNLKSNSGFISFECLDASQNKYLFEASFKRNKNNPQKVDSTRTAYKWENNQWCSIESIDAGKIFNLSYENFTRTCIIPQGKFNAFLSLSASDRTNMMKDLFNLHSYDLANNCDALIATTNKNLHEVNGQLIPLEEVNLDKINEINSNYTQNLQLIEEKRAVLQKSEQELNEMAQLELWHKDFIAKKTNLEKLQLEESKYKTLQADLNILIEVQNTFKADLQVLQQNEIAKNNTNKAIKTEQDKLNQLQNDKLQLENQSLSTQKYIQNLPQVEEEIQNINKIIEIQKIQEKITESNQNLQTQNQLIQQIDVTLKNTQLQESETIALVENLQKNQIDSDVILTINNWYQQKSHLNTQLNDLQSKNDKISQEITQILQQNALKEFGLDKNELYFDEIISVNNKNISALETEKEKHLLHLKMAEISQNLQDNEACPLCGSMDHPSVYNPKNSDQEIKNIQQKITQLKSQNELQQKNKQNYLLALQSYQINQNQQITLQQQIKQTQQQIFNFNQTFVWEQFDAENAQIFVNYNTQWNQNRKTIEEHNLKLKNLQNQLTQIQQQKAEYNAQILVYQQALSIYQQNLEQLQNQLTNITNTNYDNLNSSQLKTLVNDIITLRETMLKQHEAQKKQMELLVNQINQTQGKLQNLSEQLLVQTQQYANILSDVQKNIQKSSFTTVDEVAGFLSQKAHLMEQAPQIQNFFTQFNLASQLFTEAQKRLNKKEFHPQQLQDLKSQVHQHKTQLEEIVGETKMLQQQITTLKNNWDIKQKLVAEVEKINQRLAHLQDLKSLFRSNGFVNYIANIYLLNLIRYANVRFQKLTKGELTLTLTENDNIYVQDNLNEGKERSVKTLSGGQSFQASLCLALALADSVQNGTNHENNFFFIDEGFGTQDQESLGIVYDVLKSLTKEGKVVGFISHLSELQERIPVALNIQKNNAGSTIQVLN